jgi:hypothetical protein
MDDVDVMDLLAGSVVHDDISGEDEVQSPALPVPLPPLPVDISTCSAEQKAKRIVVQGVALDDVIRFRDRRFNSNNHHEWAPFRTSGENEVLVDPTWWSNLGTSLQTVMKTAVNITVATCEIAAPHAADIGRCEGCNSLYQAYLDAFSFARWVPMKTDAVLVPLHPNDRMAMEELARRQVLGGSAVQDKDLHQLSEALFADLQVAIGHVGGEAFAKTAEKSAKNDVTLKGHTTGLSILKELTSSEDVLKQSLGRGATGRRQTARYLVVQPWRESIRKCNEFRVVIINSQVAAVSQQTWACFVGHTIETAAACVTPIVDLWSKELLPLCPYADCILDVYVANSSAHLIEINPCGFWGSSGSALFHWVYDRDVLLDPQTITVRFVTEACEVSTLDVHAVLNQG